MQLHIYKDTDEVCMALAEWITVLIQKTLSVKENFTWAIAGGNTPKKLYSILSSEPFKEKIKWKRIHFFWGDERFVPFDDEQSNARMAYEYLFNHVKVPDKNIHKIWTDISPRESAAQYEKLLHRFFDDSAVSFDLVLCGMGEDGHTLSLFPGQRIPQGNWVAAIDTKDKGIRISLLPEVVNRSSSIVFLVTGKSKAGILKEVLSAHEVKYPVQLLKPLNGEPDWFVDREAAGDGRI